MSTQTTGMTKRVNVRGKSFTRHERQAPDLPRPTSLPPDDQLNARTKGRARPPGERGVLDAGVVSPLGREIDDICAAEAYTESS